MSAPIPTCRFITVELGWRERSRLVEDVLGNADLANIVKKCGSLQRFERAFVG